jgi:glutaredoxin
LEKEKRKIVLYGRPECHLCEEARKALLGLGADFREVNIEDDEALHAAYLERIPVVEVGGVIVSELQPDLPAIRASLDTVAA